MRFQCSVGVLTYFWRVFAVFHLMSFKVELPASTLDDLLNFLQLVNNPE